MRFVCLLLALAAAACMAPLRPVAPPAASEIILRGTISRADHQTYRELPFEAPAGTGRITVEFSYTGRDKRTVIDIGLRDPDGQRGWSGGAKSRFEITRAYATPSYTAGPLPPGQWALVLGVPNIREGETASYEARITLEPAATSPGALPSAPAHAGPVILSTRPGWRRGDFHTHTAHSDGACDQDGARAPCPSVHTFRAAETSGLDFVAITDHNTLSQLNDIRSMQPVFPRTLLIPGTEVTTFFGHANVVGNTDVVDFQLGSPRLPGLSRLLDQAASRDAFVSINHPSLPSGEVCMGCGWSVTETDWSRIDAIEVVNGSTLRTAGPESPLHGVRFWEARLSEGYRITAIGGSDNHDALDLAGARQSPIGHPATLVFTPTLSVRDVVDGVRAGHVTIDVAGLPKARLDMTARAGARTAGMGDDLLLQAGDQARLEVTLTGFPVDVRLEPRSDGLSVSAMSSASASGAVFRFSLEDGASSGWMRMNVRAADGRLLMIGNPVYIRSQ